MPPGKATPAPPNGRGRLCYAASRPKAYSSKTDGWKFVGVSQMAAENSGGAEGADVYARARARNNWTGGVPNSLTVAGGYSLLAS